jgi:hypothetical protein
MPIRAVVAVSLPFLTKCLRGELPAWAWTDAPSDLRVVGTKGYDSKTNHVFLLVESETFPLVGAAFLDGLPW